MVDEARRGLQARRVSVYGRLPWNQTALAASLFLMGWTIATLQPLRAHQPSGFDMTPTGSILRATPESPPKAHACG